MAAFVQRPAQGRNVDSSRWIEVVDLGTARTPLIF